MILSQLHIFRLVETCFFVFWRINGIKIKKIYLPLSIFWAVRGSKFKYFCNSGVQFFTSFSLYLPFQRKWLQGFFNWINRSPYIQKKQEITLSCKTVFTILVFLLEDELSTYQFFSLQINLKLIFLTLSPGHTGEICKWLLTP